MIRTVFRTPLQSDCKISVRVKLALVDMHSARASVTVFSASTNLTSNGVDNSEDCFTDIESEMRLFFVLPFEIAPDHSAYPEKRFRDVQRGVGRVVIIVCRFSDRDSIRETVGGHVRHCFVTTRFLFSRSVVFSSRRTHLYTYKADVLVASVFDVFSRSARFRTREVER